MNNPEVNLGMTQLEPLLDTLTKDTVEASPSNVKRTAYIVIRVEVRETQMDDTPFIEVGNDVAVGDTLDDEEWREVAHALSDRFGR